VSSQALEPFHALLASAGGGVDQSPTLRKRTPSVYLGKGRLMDGRGVIFPVSYRPRSTSKNTVATPRQPALIASISIPKIETTACGRTYGYQARD